MLYFCKPCRHTYWCPKYSTSWYWRCQDRPVPEQSSLYLLHDTWQRPWLNVQDLQHFLGENRRYPCHSWRNQVIPRVPHRRFYMLPTDLRRQDKMSSVLTRLFLPALGNGRPIRSLASSTYNFMAAYTITNRHPKKIRQRS